jgi:hypothetical protein
MLVKQEIFKPGDFHPSITTVTTSLYFFINSDQSRYNNSPPPNPAPIMKVSQIVAFGATIISQAEACVRIRVERWVHDGLSTIQDMRLYDNDNAVVTLPYPINFSISSDSNVLRLGGYTVELKYNDDKTNPYGGVVTYPNGCRSDACVLTSRISLTTRPKILMICKERRTRDLAITICTASRTITATAAATCVGSKPFGLMSYSR